MLYSLKLAAALLAGANALAPHIWRPENNDDVSSHKVVCGVYGDPHIEQSDGSTSDHFGLGEFQLVALPSLSGAPEVHYWGCGLTAIEKKKQDKLGFSSIGTYVGAIAIRIGNKDIEIVGNDLWIVGGEEYWVTFGAQDKPLGPFVLDALGTQITIVREAITAWDLNKAAWNDDNALKHGHLLYRWSITTEEGFSLHSHATKVSGAQGEWALDIHVDYPDTDSVKGLCIEDCDEKCSTPACLPVNSSATYGISRIFSKKSLNILKKVCPALEAGSSCPARAPTYVEACERNFKSNDKGLGDAQIACVHLSNAADSSIYEACMLDYCMGGSTDAVQEWYEEHLPPNPITCKIVADPRVTSYSGFKYDFAANGTYSVLEKFAKGEDDPCAMSIQSFECMAPCPGAMCGSSYMHAIGIKAPGGTVDHEIVLTALGETCTLDGKECGKKEDHNNGVDGIKLVPYLPIWGQNENMGDYGPGYYGWFIYAGGYAINVTVTKMNDDSFPMINLMARTPPMCTDKATGLCMTESTTKSATLQGWATSYEERHANKNVDQKKQKKQVNVLAPQDVPAISDSDVPEVAADSIMTGLKALKCLQF